MDLLDFANRFRDYLVSADLPATLLFFLIVIHKWGYSFQKKPTSVSVHIQERLRHTQKLEERILRMTGTAKTEKLHSLLFGFSTAMWKTVDDQLNTINERGRASTWFSFGRAVRQFQQGTRAKIVTCDAKTQTLKLIRVVKVQTESEPVNIVEKTDGSVQTDYNSAFIDVDKDEASTQTTLKTLKNAEVQTKFASHNQESQTTIKRTKDFWVQAEIEDPRSNVKKPVKCESRAIQARPRFRHEGIQATKESESVLTQTVYRKKEIGCQVEDEAPKTSLKREESVNDSEFPTLCKAREVEVVPLASKLPEWPSYASALIQTKAMMTPPQSLGSRTSSESEGREDSPSSPIQLEGSEQSFAEDSASKNDVVKLPRGFLPLQPPPGLFRRSPVPRRSEPSQEVLPRQPCKKAEALKAAQEEIQTRKEAKKKRTAPLYVPRLVLEHRRGSRSEEDREAVQSSNKLVVRFEETERKVVWKEEESVKEDTQPKPSTNNLAFYESMMKLSEQSMAHLKILYQRAKELNNASILEACLSLSCDYMKAFTYCEGVLKNQWQNTPHLLRNLPVPKLINDVPELVDFIDSQNLNQAISQGEG